MCCYQTARRAAKTAADVNHACSSFEPETLRQLPCGGETAKVELIEWREIRHPKASECCLKYLGYNGLPMHLIAGCRQIGE
jgi:hypothetical protein